ncbi:MAG TPA: hypothetical protein VMK65_06995 [Longimicrobiales bacterium]|nr:hypothetical protein [Longimicrobiales bacterium]
MAAPPGLNVTRLAKPARRRLELAAAAAWESLVKTHVQHSLNLVGLMGEHLSYDDAIERYVKEMGLSASMASAVRNRALVQLEAVSSERLDMVGGPPDGAEGPRRTWPMRQLNSVVREIRTRVMGNEEVDEVLKLAFARAEEGVMTTHVEQAVAFAELLEEAVGPERAIREYVGAVDLAGCRAQAVLGRAMARLADSTLPDLDGDGIPGYIPRG